MTNGVCAVVVSVDYRLAPESPWPAAAEDVYAVADWAARQAEELGGDPTRLLVAGDSAGGNLATVTALLARDRGRPAIAGQLLLYPVIAADFGTAILPPLRHRLLQHPRRRWPGTGTNTCPDLRRTAAIPTASPLQAPVDRPAAGGGDQRRLRPAVLGGQKPTRKPLLTLSVTTIHRHHAGAIHGFITMSGLDICTQGAKAGLGGVSDLCCPAHWNEGLAATRVNRKAGRRNSTTSEDTMAGPGTRSIDTSSFRRTPMPGLISATTSRICLRACTTSSMHGPKPTSARSMT